MKKNAKIKNKNRNKSKKNRNIDRNQRGKNLSRMIAKFMAGLAAHQESTEDPNTQG